MTRPSNTDPRDGLITLLEWWFLDDEDCPPELSMFDRVPKAADQILALFQARERQAFRNGQLDCQKADPPINKLPTVAVGMVIDDKLAQQINKAREAYDQLLLEAKHSVLQDLLDWHKLWFNTHDKDDPFNWYGAVKAMQVMKDPQKPFHELKQLGGKADG